MNFRNILKEQYSPDIFKKYNINTLKELATLYYQKIIYGVNLDQLIYDFIYFKGIDDSKFANYLKTFNEYLRKMKRNDYLKNSDLGFDWETVKLLVFHNKLKTKHWILNKTGKWIPIDKYDKDYENGLIANDIKYIGREDVAKQVLKARKNKK